MNWSFRCQQCCLWALLLTNWWIWGTEDFNIGPDAYPDELLFNIIYEHFAILANQVIIFSLYHWTVFCVNSSKHLRLCFFCWKKHTETCSGRLVAYFEAPSSCWFHILKFPLWNLLLIFHEQKKNVLWILWYPIYGYRGTQGGAVLSLAIAVYLAFQHFTRVGGLGKAFEQGSIIATLAIICIMIVPLMLLFWFGLSWKVFASHYVRRT